MRPSLIRRLLPSPAANSARVPPSVYSLMTVSPTPKPRAPPDGMRFTSKAPSPCVRNWKSSASSFDPRPDFHRGVVSVAQRLTGMRLSLFQRHIARLPDVVRDCDECLQIG